MLHSQAKEAPLDGREIAGDYVAHEQALLDFAELEIAGVNGSSKVEEFLKLWSEKSVSDTPVGGNVQDATDSHLKSTFDRLF